MSDNDDDLEIYVFQGNKGERVPETVEKLIVNPGVPSLPTNFCHNYTRLREVTLRNGLRGIGGNAFCSCENLSEIKICNTLRCIGKNAFTYCTSLTKIEFEDDPITANNNDHAPSCTIDSEAFRGCFELPAIKLPAFVTKIGGHTFDSCHALMEVNLSATCITEISEWGFANCPWLQSVALPNTLEQICQCAFCPCPRLVTVGIPLDGRPIKIGQKSFWSCSSLANLVLPRDSSAEEDSFHGCTLLQRRFGADSTQIVAGLTSRFDGFVIQRMCYDHAGITVEKFQQCIKGQDEAEDALADTFGMTAFHVLFSRVEPSGEFLEILLDYLPHHTLKWYDSNGKRPLDYLVNNWCDSSSRFFQMALQKWLIDAITCWGAVPWIEAIKDKVRMILSAQDEGQRWMLHEELYSTFEGYEQIAATSILELALWKGQLVKGDTTDENRMSDDREEPRCLCSANVVIPNVFKFFA